MVFNDLNILFFLYDFISNVYVIKLGMNYKDDIWLSYIFYVCACV